MISTKYHILRQYLLSVGLLTVFTAYIVITLDKDSSSKIQQIKEQKLNTYLTHIQNQSRLALITENQRKLEELSETAAPIPNVCAVIFYNASGTVIYRKQIRQCTSSNTTSIPMDIHSDNSSIVDDNDLDMYEHNWNESETLLGSIEVIAEKGLRSNADYAALAIIIFQYIAIPIIALTVFFVLRRRTLTLIHSVARDLENDTFCFDNCEGSIKHNPLFKSMMRIKCAGDQREKEQQKLLDCAVDESHEKTMYLAAMSHELRNPLNAVITYNKHALDELHNAKQTATIQKHILESIHASEILANVINDILDKEMLDLGTLVLSDEPIDISRIIEESFSIIENAYPLFNAKLLKPEQVYLPFVASGDSNRIKQILINLLSNSVKHTSKGYVEIQYTVEDTSQDKCKVHFVVKDTGTGIPAEMLGSIFEAYFKSSNGSGTNKSSGLGLYIAKKIVELYDGEISIDSTLNYGTTANVTLCLKKSNPSSPYFTINENLDPDNADLIAAVKGKSILVVDDCPANANSIKIMLEKYPVDVSCLKSGDEAIEWLPINRCDCVIMDVSMPDMDGHEATEIIRNSLDINVPIIAVTAHAFQDEREKCMRSGMNDFQTKPVNTKKLLSAIFRHFGYDSKLNTSQCSESEDPFSTIYPGVDLSEPLHTLGHDMQLICMNLSIFVDRYGDKANPLKHLCISQEKTASFAHKLKNDAGNIGAKEIEAICVILDREQLNSDLRANLITELEEKLPVVVESAKKAEILLEERMQRGKGDGADAGH